MAFNNICTLSNLALSLSTNIVVSTRSQQVFGSESVLLDTRSDFNNSAHIDSWHLGNGYAITQTGFCRFIDKGQVLTGSILLSVLHSGSHVTCNILVYSMRY